MKVQTYDEDKILKEARQGSSPAMARLVRHHQNEVYSVALRMLGNREDAEDVLQETFLAFFKNINRFQGLSKVSTYLFRMATNFSLMKLRKRKTRKPEQQAVSLTEALEEPDRTPGPDERLVNKELKEKLDQALLKLPEKERAVFILRDVENLPGEQVTKILNISLAAMKSRLHRARAQLREHLTPYIAG
jgi:RNA polymerase sigma-70 factor (ECF subfamily)